MDLYSEGNTLYEYQVRAKRIECGENQTPYDSSNISVGFRTPSSNICGQITYENGLNPVANSTVFAESNNPLLNKSLIFDGQNDFIDFGIDNIKSAMFWFTPNCQSCTYSLLTIEGVLPNTLEVTDTMLILAQKK